MFEYLQLVLGFIAPPVVSVFLLGLFWKRSNANGAFFALIVGFVLTISLIFIKLTNAIPAIAEIHYLHTAPLLLLFCALVNVVISLATQAPAPEKTDALTWRVQIFNEETEELKGLPWFKNYRILAVLLLIVTAIIVGIYW